MVKKTNKSKTIANSNKEKLLPKVKELNQSDPSLSYSEIISKLNLDIDKSTLGRWVRELKANNQWKSPSDEVSTEMDVLADKIRNAGKMSKLGLSKLLKVSRHKIDKAIAYIANTGDASAKSTDTISTTANNVISISPANNKDLVEGGIYHSFNRNGTDDISIILKIIPNKKDKLKSRVWYSTYPCDVSEDETFIPRNNVPSSDQALSHAMLEPINVCSYSTFKRRSKLDCIGSSQHINYVNGKIVPELLTKGEIPLSACKANSTIESLLEGFSEKTNTSNTSNRKQTFDEDTNSKNENDKYETSFEDQESVKVKEVTRVEALIPNMKSCPFRAVLTESSVTIYEGINANTINKEEKEKYDSCLTFIENGKWDELKELCCKRNKTAINNKVNFEKFGFSVKGGYVSFGEKGGLGKMMVNGIDTLVKRANHYIENGDLGGADKIGKFISNLTMNPDQVVISRIIDFIKFKDIEITPNGDLIVYKMVKHDYTDCYTSTVDNSIGSRVFMRRTLVNNNESQTCSNGLHVCALNYFGSFNSNSNRLVSCLLDPRDIVSIPADYAGSKIRCCSYTVLEDVTSDFMSGKIKADTIGEFKD